MLTANMAQNFQIPLIYDEVQTGFGLGGDFFWYQLFDLQDSFGQSIHPDFGFALKNHGEWSYRIQKIPFDESYAVHSFIRGCFTGLDG